jgi:hypothetical protein
MRRGGGRGFLYRITGWAQGILNLFLCFWFLGEQFEELLLHLSLKGNLG